MKNRINDSYLFYVWYPATLRLLRLKRKYPSILNFIPYDNSVVILVGAFLFIYLFMVYLTTSQYLSLKSLNGRIRKEAVVAHFRIRLPGRTEKKH
jgi:hypothetical protein